jgi:hypothetical protein
MTPVSPVRQRARARTVWALACALLTVLATLGDTTVSAARTRSKSTPPPLVFGIYPGGAAGTVGPSGPVKPEDPALRLSALERLRPSGRPFVLHLYVGYSGAGGYSAEQQIGAQIAAYGRAGFQTELVLCYRPTDGGSAADVSGFVQFVRKTVDTMGSDRGLVSLQVTDEANQGGSPNTSDGSYLGAPDALIDGVIAAKVEIRKDGRNRIKVGFNWADSADGPARAFWQYLGRHGGRRFVDALDWVGLDAYPFTWDSPPPPGKGGLGAASASFIDGVLGRLRSTYLPLAGIPRSVSLELSEIGYPTGPGRTYAMQATVLKATASAVYRARGTYNVTGYRWFDLRDADSSSSSFESQYGLMRDDYTPKSAFGVYRALVAKFSK